VKAIPAAVILAGISACSPASDKKAESDYVFVFDGRLISIDGVDTPNTRIEILLTRSPKSDSLPDQYALRADCIDSGFLNKADGRYWSGMTPSKNGEMEDFIREVPLDARCPIEDRSRYVRLVGIMREGAKLDFDTQQTTATFSAPTKGTAKFQVQPNFVID